VSHTAACAAQASSFVCSMMLYSTMVLSHWQLDGMVWWRTHMCAAEYAQQI
jgi:hypothetical protein